MSKNKPRNVASYKISVRAEQDLVDIYVRGFRQWGENRADDYQLKLISSFHLLAEHPGIGNVVAIRPHLQRHEVAPTIIFYRKFACGVRIARILYKNRAMDRHL